MTKQLSGFEKLKAKRSELNGGAPGDRFIWRVDPTAEDGQKFAILNPFMLDDDAKDDLALIDKQYEDGELLPSELNREILDFYLLDEERDDFEALADSGDMEASTLLGMILEEFKEKNSPTRKTSLRRSKR